MLVCCLHTFDLCLCVFVCISPPRVVLFFHRVLSLFQVWPLTPGIWTTTPPCSRGSNGTPPAWSVSTWLSPTGEAGRDPVPLAPSSVGTPPHPDVSGVRSEHSRHWFFRGRMEIDGQEQKDTLFSLIMDTQRSSNQNNVIKFCDNSR